ncbi:hypothetical protein B0H11DRAFT_2257325 [Mycena galericulata]|nr:hypothetical protein B0H11DRAFT_2257325 [Mycena galericulata]
MFARGACRVREVLYGACFVLPRTRALLIHLRDFLQPPVLDDIAARARGDRRLLARAVPGGSQVNEPTSACSSVRSTGGAPSGESLQQIAPGPNAYTRCPPGAATLARSSTCSYANALHYVHSLLHAEPSLDQTIRSHLAAVLGRDELEVFHRVLDQGRGCLLALDDTEVDTTYVTAIETLQAVGGPMDMGAAISGKSLMTVSEISEGTN